MTKKPVAALMLCLSLAASTHAYEYSTSGDKEPKVEVVAEKPGTYDLKYMTDEEGTATVMIRDASKEIIFSEVIAYDKSFVKPYNLSMLPEGTYMLEVKSGKRTITSEKIELRTPAPEFRVKANRMQQDEKVALTVFSSNMVPVTIKVYDTFNNLLITDYVDAPKSFTRVYDFSKTWFDGKVTIEVEQGWKEIDSITL